MKTAIIACQTIENELREAMARTGCSYDLYFFESGLHNVPMHLKEKVQEQLDNLPADVERVLLAMGTCGNSVQGLRTRNFSLILPRVDDCISLMLGSMQARREAGKDGGTYFMTAGWLTGERHIGKEYDYTIEKYGEETGEMIFSMMLGNYKRMALVDTGCFDFAAAEAETRKVADKLHLEYAVMPGRLDYIEELLTGPWEPDRYILTGKNSEITDILLN